jgi:lantibiotic transport system permease protein
MRKLFRTEIIKLQWILIFFLIAIDAVINAGLGAMYTYDFKQLFKVGWESLYLQTVSFHALFFYPLYTGVFASLICHYEHKNGGWKQLFSLPIKRSYIYWAKFLILMILMAISQGIFFLAYLISGNLMGLQGHIPWTTLFISLIGGWIAVFPLAAFQIFISQKIKTFGVSIIFNIFCVIPNIVLTGLNSTIGSWFPFTLPYYAMFPKGTTLSPNFDFYPFVIILFITLVIYVIIGRRSLIKQDSF